jgi:Helix-turn-helix.
MTQEQLAQAITYSPSLVAMVENGKRAPSRDFAKRCDAEFKTDGLFERILDNLIAKDVTPEWFRPWVMIEQEATSLWLFHALAIPGLFQTEAYARAQLQDDDGKTAARMERQEILKRAKPPALVALLDERVLRYAVGDNAVMHEQMRLPVQRRTAVTASRWRTTMRAPSTCVTARTRAVRCSASTRLPSSRSSRTSRLGAST